MNAFDLFFIYGPAIKNLFVLGLIPKESDFVELQQDEMDSYFKDNPATEEKIFQLKPLTNDERFKGMTVCMTETEKEVLLHAAKQINGYAKDMTFDNDEEKLQYVAIRLPSVFSEGTKFEKSRCSVE